MIETFALHKQLIQNKPDTDPTFLLNEQIQTSSLEVDKLVNDLQDPKKTPYLTTEDRDKFTDQIVENWGSTLVDLMQGYAPEQLKQNIENIEHIFSKNFANGKYTKYWDADFQRKELLAVTEFNRATEMTAQQLQKGNAQHWQNKLVAQAEKIQSAIKAAKGELSVGERKKLYEEVQAIEISIKGLKRKGSVALDDGTVPDVPLVDEKSLRKWAEGSYDLLWAPVNRFLEKKLRDLSQDDNSESARLFLKELRTNAGSRWRTWRSWWNSYSCR